MALIPFDTARQRLLDEAASLSAAVEHVAVAKAQGRVLAADIVAPIGVPGFANASMDGYAVCSAGHGVRPGQAFRIVDLGLAGSVAPRLDDHGDCAEIATGAPMPEGADCVVPYELVERAGRQVQIRAVVAAGQNMRGATDDYAPGQHALAAGRALDAGALAVIAGFGLQHIAVRRRPRIALVVTGTELQVAGGVLGFGQIFDSNSALVRALLAAHGDELSIHGPLRDHRALIAATLDEAARHHDVILTAGGVSAGRADFVPGLVAEMGEIRQWKLATRPGMPFLHGRIGAATIYGLPGNPVSVFASMLTLVLPALRAMQGQVQPPREHAVLAEPLRKSHARLEWRRGCLSSASDGRRLVHAHPAQGSGMLRGVAESNALFRIEAETRVLGAGAVVEVLPFPA